MKIKRNYSFWKHPIRWFLDIKKFRLINILLQRWIEEGLEEELAQVRMDMFLYGGAIMKNGKRIDPTTLK